MTFVQLDQADLIDMAMQKKHVAPELLVACFESLKTWQKDEGEMVSDLRDFRKVLTLNLKLSKVSIINDLSSLQTELQLICEAIMQICCIIQPAERQLKIVKQILADKDVIQIFHALVRTVKTVNVPLQPTFSCVPG